MPRRTSASLRLRGAPLGADLLLAAVVGFLGFPAAAAPPELSGWVALSGGSIDSAPSFLHGGIGKLIDGEAPESARADGLTAEARLAVDWEINSSWRLFVHGVARRDPAAVENSAASGLLEAFFKYRRGFGTGQEIGIKAGQFFLPTSLENVDPLWTSPYTLTLSSMNSWIAEEIRPIGLDLSWRKTFSNEHRLTLAVTTFGGNDTSGTLLAWRGFALHDRPTPTGQFVPLPPLASFPAQFPEQSRAGSRPFGKDLDGRAGYAGRAKWTAANGALVQATIFINNGDRDLYGEEYAWDTDFRWLAVSVPLPGELVLLGEWGTGTTEMGFAPAGSRSRSRVDIEHDTLYLVLSREWGPLRLSVRWDDFVVDDRDNTPGDDNRENGSSWTLAAMARLGKGWQLGAEYLSLDAERPAAVRLGVSDLDAESFRLLGRFSF